MPNDGSVKLLFTKYFCDCRRYNDVRQKKKKTANRSDLC